MVAVRMRSIYIASTEGSGGKTTLAVGLALALRRRGYSVGYFKPVGAIPHPVRVDGDTSDDDARFVARVLDLAEKPSELCPVMLDEDAVHQVLGGARSDAMYEVRRSFEQISAGKDLLVCEGLGEVWQGRFLGTSGRDIVAALDLAALLIARYVGPRLLDDICYVKDSLKERLLGVVFTQVPESRRDVVAGDYRSFLRGNGIEMFGVLPADPRLSSVTVGEIAVALEATYVSGEEFSEAAVESYLIGAMSPEHALRYFEQTPRKAVVVGGDRAEIVLAALETSTSVVVLTGGHVPSATVLARAQEVAVPMLSVSTDTVAAADSIRRIFGRLGGHDPRKVDLIGEVVESNIDLDRLTALLAD
jgi:uncharacterized protein